MEQDKTKILSDLYAIRATMSVVAMNDDEAEEQRETIQNLCNEQSIISEEIRESENTLAVELYTQEGAVKKQVEALRKKRKEKGNALELGRERLNSSIASYIWENLWHHTHVGCLLGVILVTLIAVGTIISFVVAIVWDREIGYWMGYLYDSLICAAVILAYIFFICVPSAIHDRNNDIRHIDKLDLEIPQIDQELNEITALYEIYSAYCDEVYERMGSCQPINQTLSVPNHHASIDKLIQEHEEIVAELESQKGELEREKNIHQELIKANAEKTALIVKEGTTAYPLIDFRDWENVDLIIYYFETGRAEDMKEALQLVDRQKQTEQITNALAMASREICKTINTSITRLGSALAQSFSVLSRQMAQQHAEMMAGMEQKAEAQRREIRAQTAEQRNAQAMNQALLEKISVSSLDLAEKMARQMREVHGLY